MGKNEKTPNIHETAEKAYSTNLINDEDASDVDQDAEAELPMCADIVSVRLSYMILF